MPVANARMYSATPEVREAWKVLLRWVLARADLSWDVIDYDAPAPLSVLWARDDLGLLMMCGLPFAQRETKPILIAAPVPSPLRYGGAPVYFTDMVVRADAPFQTLKETFGGTVGYTLSDSMSGGLAFARHLAPHRAREGTRLYTKAVGNLIHARGVIEALVDGRIDIGPLDSYYHDLLRHNAPALAAQVRVVASTGPMPIPPLVATAALAPDELQRLRKALADVAAAVELQPVRERVLLAGFVSVDPAAYDVLAATARRPVPSFEEL
ncbi:phosphate/phosphite/phosphonate ABC transporter substrate-binding protein [Variovorax sp. RHLX14]|uniref:phosphate/phosphite/phosphonate ABC transporter substrate-binding protein n=1 Tax=Variovorax sp. RHLX14 TaxID=1259731 RepID=UPI003F459F21